MLVRAYSFFDQTSPSLRFFPSFPYELRNQPRGLGVSLEVLQQEEEEEDQQEAFRSIVVLVISRSLFFLIYPTTRKYGPRIILLSTYVCCFYLSLQVEEVGRSFSTPIIQMRITRSFLPHLLSLLSRYRRRIIEVCRCCQRCPRLPALSYTLLLQPLGQEDSLFQAYQEEKAEGVTEEEEEAEEKKLTLRAMSTRRMEGASGKRQETAGRDNRRRDQEAKVGPS